MHILYLHQYFATPHGKTGTRSYEFARRWVAQGHRVTMVTSAAQLTPEDLGGAPRKLTSRINVEGIEVIALNLRYRQAMGFVRRVIAFMGFMFLSSWAALRVRSVDVVFATSTPLTIGVPALLVRWLRRRPYVFEVRDVWPAAPIAMGALRNRLLIAFLRRLERIIYRNARAVVTLSPGMEADVRKSAPPDKRLVMVPNSSDPDLFRPDLDGETLRRERGWGDRCVCIYTGALGPANGVDILLRAAQHFRDDPDLLFVVLGEGSEKKKLIAQRDQLGLDNLYIAGGVPKHQLSTLIAAADIGLVLFAPIPILEDNSANKFFDYLSAGKPVLLNYGGWQREVIESAQTGLGCKMGDEQAFFANLANLKRDKDRRDRMGQHARRLALERFNRDVLARQVLDVIVDAYRC